MVFPCDFKFYFERKLTRYFRPSVFVKLPMEAPVTWRAIAKATPSRSTCTTPRRWRTSAKCSGQPCPAVSGPTELCTTVTMSTAASLTAARPWKWPSLIHTVGWFHFTKFPCLKFELGYCLGCVEGVWPAYKSLYHALHGNCLDCTRMHISLSITCNKQKNKKRQKLKLTNVLISRRELICWAAVQSGFRGQTPFWVSPLRKLCYCRILTLHSTATETTRLPPS